MKDNLNNYLKEILEVLLHVFIVFTIIVIIPYLVSGIWPPFSSVLSESMEPNIQKNDMIFIIDNERYTDSNLYGGIHTIDDEKKKSFNEYGSVILYKPDGNSDDIPVIHRAAYFTEEDEDWTLQLDRNDTYYNSCSSIDYCPAPNKGYITLGDNNNGVYDQTAGISKPVKEEWIIGRAQYRAPSFGTIRNIIHNNS